MNLLRLKMWTLATLWGLQWTMIECLMQLVRAGEMQCRFRKWTLLWCMMWAPVMANSSSLRLLRALGTWGS